MCCIIVVDFMLLSAASGAADAMKSDPVEVKDVRISSAMGMCYIETDIMNVSEKQIAYLTVDYYYYDRMGTFQYNEERNHTGPFEPQHIKTFKIAPMVSNLGAVWPKTIKVEYTDGGVTIANHTMYYCTSDYYGGKLKK